MPMPISRASRPESGAIGRDPAAAFADDETQAIVQAEEVLGDFAERFQATYLAGMRMKLGLFGAEAGDGHLVQDFLNLLLKAESDFTLAFRRLGEAAENPEGRRSSAQRDREDGSL